MLICQCNYCNATQPMRTNSTPPVGWAHMSIKSFGKEQVDDRHATGHLCSVCLDTHFASLGPWTDSIYKAGERAEYDKENDDAAS